MITFGSEVLNKYGVKINKGSVVVKEGDRTRDMFFVHKGELEVFSTINGKERIIKNISNGEFFGEMSLLNNEPRSASVRAIQPSVLIKISPNIFEGLIKKMPDFALKIIIVLANRLRQINQEVTTLHEKDDDLKLLRSVMTKIESIGEESIKGIKVNVSIEQIGDEINAGSDVVEKVKSELKMAQNVLEFNENGTFVVYNKELFEHFIKFIRLRNKFIKRHSEDSENHNLAKQVAG